MVHLTDHDLKRLRGGFLPLFIEDDPPPPPPPPDGAATGNIRFNPPF